MFGNNHNDGLSLMLFMLAYSGSLASVHALGDRPCPPHPVESALP